MGLGPSSAVLETLGRNDPGLTLQVDFGPSGADHFARPKTCQQRDFKSSSDDALSLAQAEDFGLDIISNRANYAKERADRI